MQILEERLERLYTLTLDRHEHSSFEQGHCAMEVAAWISGEDHTDNPQCVSPALRKLIINLNDGLDDNSRQQILPFIPKLVGTAFDAKDIQRSFLALDWMLRDYTPTVLESAGFTEFAKEVREMSEVSTSQQAVSLIPRIQEMHEVVMEEFREALDKNSHHTDLYRNTNTRRVLMKARGDFKESVNVSGAREAAHAFFTPHLFGPVEDIYSLTNSAVQLTVSQVLSASEEEALNLEDLGWGSSITQNSFYLKVMEAFQGVTPKLQQSMFSLLESMIDVE